MKCFETFWPRRSAVLGLNNSFLWLEGFGNRMTYCSLKPRLQQREYTKSSLSTENPFAIWTTFDIQPILPEISFLEIIALQTGVR